MKPGCFPATSRISLLSNWPHLLSGFGQIKPSPFYKEEFANFPNRKKNICFLISKAGRLGARAVRRTVLCFWLHRRQFAKQFAAQLPYLIQREVDLSFEVIHEHVDDPVGEEVNLEHADARIAGQRVQMDVLVDAVDADAFQFVDELTRQIGGDGSWRRAIDVLPRCDDAWALRIACDSLRREDKRAQLLQLRFHHLPFRRHIYLRWHDGLDMEAGDTPCDWFAGLHPRQRPVQKERSASLKKMPREFGFAGHLSFQGILPLSCLP